MSTGDASRSGGAQGDGTPAIIESAPTILTAAPGPALVVPYDAFLLKADFARAGADLVLTDDDGTTVVIVDYFALADPPALATADGATLRPDLVARLAGPLAPGQYAQLAGGPEAAPIGRVVTVEGSVSATRADGTQVTLTTDSPVFQGDVIETASDGAVGLVFNDDTTFSLGESARMVLDKLIYNPDTGVGESTFSIIQGAFVFVTGEIAGSQPDAMIVRTPVATIGIRGTTVAGQISIDGTDSTISLLADADGSVGQIVITTNSGARLFLDKPFQAAVFDSPTLEPTIVELQPTQVDELFGRVLRINDVTQQYRDASRDGETDEEEEADDAAADEVAVEEAVAAAAAAADEETEALAAADDILTAEEIAAAEAAAIEAELAAVMAGELPPEGLLEPEFVDILETQEFVEIVEGQETVTDDLTDAELADLDLAASSTTTDIEGVFVGFVDVTGGYDFPTIDIDDNSEGPPDPVTITTTTTMTTSTPPNEFFPADKPEEPVTTTTTMTTSTPPPTFAGFTGNASQLSGQIFSGGGFGSLNITSSSFGGSRNPSASLFDSINFGSAGGTSFSLSDGILLTTGEGVPSDKPSDVLNKDIVSVDDDILSAEQDADLANVADVSPTSTFDSTSLTFQITDVPVGVTAIVFTYMFGTDDQTNSDLAGVFVDDGLGGSLENYLLFPGGEFLRYEDPDTTANFFDTDANNPPPSRSLTTSSRRRR